MKELKTMREALQGAANRGLIQNKAEDKALKGGDIITIDGTEMTNFGSCSYLGIELDNRIKNSMKDMVDRYGSMLSSARVYLSLDAYHEAEELLGKVFKQEAIVSSTCTLGHLANIPILVGKNDLVILDQQVHNSIATAVSLTSLNGCKVIRIKHSRMDILEKEIVKNQNNFDKIWYMADGVYSIFGDVIPIREVHDLMNKYSNFYLYVDDAHEVV